MTVVRDPDLGTGNTSNCTEGIVLAKQPMGPHVAALGMKFYNTDNIQPMFPSHYHNAIFIAQVHFFFAFFLFFFVFFCFFFFFGFFCCEFANLGKYKMYNLCICVTSMTMQSQNKHYSVHTKTSMEVGIDCR